jgi:hypothetical protein
MKPPEDNLIDYNHVKASADFLWSLDLSVRATNVLFCMDISSYAELSSLNKGLLSRRRNCGKKTIAEIMRLVESLRRSTPPKQRAHCHFSAPIESLTLSTSMAAHLKQLGIHTTVALAAAPEDDLIDARERLWEFFLTTQEACSLLDDDTDVEFLRLSVRATRAAQVLNAETVGALAGLKPDAFLGLENVGRRSLCEIHSKLLKYFVNRDSTAVRTVPDDPKAFVEMLLGELPRDQKDVLIKRFGFWSRKPETLQDVGDTRGCTRERVRQIESKALSSLSWPGNSKFIEGFFDGLFAHHFQPVFQARHGVATEDELRDVFLSLFAQPQEGMSVERLFTRALLDGRSIYEARFIKIRDAVLALTEEIGRVYLNVLQFIERHLDHVKKPLPLSALLESCQTDSASRWPVETQMLQRFVTISPSLRRDDEGFVGLAEWTYTNPKTVQDMIVRALIDIGKPAHFTQIAMRVNQGFSRQQPMKPRNVHARLLHDEETFVWQSSGVYGLSAWGLKRAPFVKNRLLEILRSAKRPMSLDQIVPKVLETCHCNEHTPGAILEAHRELFVRLDKGIYGLREWKAHNSDYFDD